MSYHKTSKLLLWIAAALAISVLVIVTTGVSDSCSASKDLESKRIGNAPDDIHPTPEELLLEKGFSVTVPQLIATLKSDDESEDIRFWAALVLGRKGDRSVSYILIDTLRNQSPKLRAGAVLALGDLRDPSALPYLRQTLQDASEPVRSATVQVLGRIDDNEAITALGEKVVDLNESSVNIRVNAAFQLGQMGSTAAEPWLNAGLNDKSLEVRAASAVALAKLGNWKAVPTLIEILRTPNVRESVVVEAIEGLKRLTGQDFGYPKKYFAPATKEERAEAIRKWIEWWENQ